MTGYSHGIEPGDIVTGYHTGYHKVSAVNNSTVYYTRIDGKSRTKKSCHVGYCTKIDPEALYHEQVKEAEELRAMLMEALGR